MQFSNSIRGIIVTLSFMQPQNSNYCLLIWHDNKSHYRVQSRGHFVARKPFMAASRGRSLDSAEAQFRLMRGGLVSNQTSAFTELVAVESSGTAEKARLQECCRVAYIYDLNRLRARKHIHMPGGQASHLNRRLFFVLQLDGCAIWGDGCG